MSLSSGSRVRPSLGSRLAGKAKRLFCSSLDIWQAIRIMMITIRITRDMSSEPFLREYLYGPSALEEPVGSRSQEPAAIPGRRAPVHLAGRLGQIMRGVVSEVLEPHGLTPPHWGVMVAIA